MKIKSGDIVKIVNGKDKGKTGKVLQSFSQTHKASIEGINLLIKNLKSRKQGEKGQRIHFPAPINIANLMLICPKCSKATRIGFKLLENKKKTRQCKKCKEVID